MKHALANESSQTQPVSKRIKCDDDEAKEVELTVLTNAPCDGQGGESAFRVIDLKLTAISGNKLAVVSAEHHWTAEDVAIAARGSLKAGRWVHSLVLPSGVLFSRDMTVGELGFAGGETLVATFVELPTTAVSDLCSMDVGVSKCATKTLMASLDHSAWLEPCLTPLANTLTRLCREPDSDDDVAWALRGLEATLRAHEQTGAGSRIRWRKRAMDAMERQGDCEAALEFIVAYHGSRNHRACARIILDFIQWGRLIGESCYSC